MESLTNYTPRGTISVVKSAFTVQWTIDNFTTICDKTKTTEFIRSPLFTTSIGSEYECCIKLYPNGDLDTNQGYISIAVEYFNTDGVDASVEFSVLNNKFQVYKSLTTTPNNGKPKNLSYEIGRLIEQSTVLSKQYGLLFDGALTFSCQIKENTVVAYESIHEQLQKNLRLVEFDVFERILKSENYSDFTLTVGDATFPVHKCILAAKSPVFAAMFANDMKEKKENVVEIKDVKPEVMAEVLRFIYAGKVGEIKSFALDLYVAAEKYSIDALKDVSEDIISKNLTTTNIVECFNFASLHQAKKLMAAVIDFIALNAEHLKSIDLFKS